MKSGLIQALHIAATKSNWGSHDRWQDYAISPRRALVELVATAFVLIALAIAVVPYDQARETYFQIAGSLSLRTEDAPQLANVASQRVLATGSYGP